MASNMAKRGSRPVTGQKQPVKASEKIFPFTRENYILIIIGLVVVIIGYLLMTGGRSPDPNQFYPDQVYSWRRITLAPIVIMIGFLLEVYAIMKRPKEELDTHKNTEVK